MDWNSRDIRSNSLRVPVNSRIVMALDRERYLGGVAAPFFKAMIRLFFNAHEEFPLIWSIDEGSIASEHKIARVDFGISLRGRTGYNPQAPQGEPKAWIEFENCEVLFYAQDSAYIVSKT